MSKLIPENGRVVVKRKDSEQVSPGGIVIPETSQKKSQIGEVLAVNEYRNEHGIKFQPQFSVGDTVIFRSTPEKSLSFPAARKS